MRLLSTIGVYLAALALIGVAAFFMVMVLAGPHGGLLPRVFEIPILILGWLFVLLGPAWIARIAWRRLG